MEEGCNRSGSTFWSKSCLSGFCESIFLELNGLSWPSRPCGTCLTWSSWVQWQYRSLPTSAYSSRSMSGWRARPSSRGLCSLRLTWHRGLDSHFITGQFILTCSSWHLLSKMNFWFWPVQGFVSLIKWASLWFNERK